MAETVVNRIAPTLSERTLLIRAGAIGAGAGILTWLLSLLIRTLFIEPVFCRSTDNFGVCAQGGDIAWVSALVVVSVVAVLALVRVGIYRPLMVVLAVLIAFFGLAPWLAPLEWYWALLWHVVLFGVAYALFAWLATIEKFVVTLIVTLVAVLIIRLTILF